ncbi:hypothetical protein CERSUDRAFT_87942 [Gelatoporia subvermispora B]|uniref:Uncharacterized protein n=1 Tax=Ceriporiopsis subvermispora (strain B) TaxID=914234 RepID=M2Q720_CERS8|nr:hypothetical protein CERSUDRAFT_87942 [Gelatoporia subvermispora B]
MSTINTALTSIASTAPIAMFPTLLIPGFVCLAVLTTPVEGELEVAEEAGVLDTVCEDTVKLAVGADVEDGFPPERHAVEVPAWTTQSSSAWM